MKICEVEGSGNCGLKGGSPWKGINESFTSTHLFYLCMILFVYLWGYWGPLELRPTLPFWQGFGNIWDRGSELCMKLDSDWNGGSSRRISWVLSVHLSLKIWERLSPSCVWMTWKGILRCAWTKFGSFRGLGRKARQLKNPSLLARILSTKKWMDNGKEGKEGGIQKGPRSHISQPLAFYLPPLQHPPHTSQILCSIHTHLTASTHISRYQLLDIKRIRAHSSIKECQIQLRTASQQSTIRSLHNVSGNTLNHF